MKRPLWHNYRTDLDYDLALQRYEEELRNRAYQQEIETFVASAEFMGSEEMMKTKRWGRCQSAQ